MRRVVLAEWVRLRSRRFVAGAGGALVGIPVLVAAMLPTLIEAQAPGAGSLGQLGSVGALARPDGVGAALELSSGLLALTGLVIGAALVGRDLSGGTWRAQLVTEPRRAVLLLGKYAALASFTALALVPAAGLSALVASLSLRSVVATSAWSTAGGVAALAGAWANVTLAVLVWGAVGVTLAVLTRSTIAAVGLALLWQLVLEPALGALVAGASPWLPTEVLHALAGGGAPLGYRTALLVSLATGVGALAMAVQAVRRRDVTA